MRSGLRVEGPLIEQSSVCEQVLRALPQWFGIESATQGYIASAVQLPSFVAYQGDAAVGLALFKRHFELAAEVYLIGVLPEQHRQGVGRALLAAGEAWLVQQGVRFLQVKTLSGGRVDAGYAKTRQFYLGVGFTPLEELPTLWDPSNPCLLLIKQVGAG
jgi:GNAT superfamily N-acetyltransferase